MLESNFPDDFMSDTNDDSIDDAAALDQPLTVRGFFLGISYLT
jgi:hypothetical protein